MDLYGRVTVTRGGPPQVLRLAGNGAAGGQPAPDPADARLLDARETLDSATRAPSVVFRHGGLAPDDRAWAAGAGGIVVGLPPTLSYLAAGDVVRLHADARDLRVLYRRASRFNALLVTERCNSLCVMCSQPPRAHDDSYLIEEALQAIRLMAPDTSELGITGGEPSLLREGLLRIIAEARDRLPKTALHVLSNGRLFAYTDYARALTAVGHPDFVIGIPLYSDLPATHDFVVQARGAFDQTVHGLLNLARYGQRIEVRVVVHRLNYERLPALGRYLARNLPFVEHVALMGLELMGYARTNLDALWIDPVAYQEELQGCAREILHGGSRVSIYNHPLCVLDRSLWPLAHQSISDWKNVYLPVCERCAARDLCGGFFASAGRRHSAHIRAVEPSEMAGLAPAKDPDTGTST